MRILIGALVLMVTMVLVGCSPAVVRDEAVYRTELDFMEQAAVQPATSLEEFIQQHCACGAGHFVTPECKKAAKLVLTVKTRVPYHKAMMLFNARLLEERPPKTPPEIPSPDTLCPKP
jgi:hypothetical protein